MDNLDLLQWPAMAVSVIAAWLVGSTHSPRRRHGFWWFLVSNVLWSVWGWHTQAWALIGLQAALVIMNLRGSAKNDRP